MIPVAGCDPKNNVYFIGGMLLKAIKGGVSDINFLLLDISAELDVSYDHVILSLDWLFTISAIDVVEEMVIINES